MAARTFQPGKPLCTVILRYTRPMTAMPCICIDCQDILHGFYVCPPAPARASARTDAVILTTRASAVTTCTERISVARVALRRAHCNGRLAARPERPPARLSPADTRDTRAIGSVPESSCRSSTSSSISFPSRRGSGSRLKTARLVLVVYTYLWPGNSQTAERPYNLIAFLMLTAIEFPYPAVAAGSPRQAQACCRPSPVPKEATCRPGRIGRSSWRRAPLDGVP